MEEASKTIAHQIGGIQNDVLRFGLPGVKSDIVGSHPLESSLQSVPEASWGNSFFNAGFRDCYRKMYYLGFELISEFASVPNWGGLPRLILALLIAGKINTIIRDAALRELGQLEQDLVFGDTAAKDNTTPEYKLRLLMIYASVYPQKFEGDKGLKLMQLAKLSPDDMKVISNMQLLAGSSTKKASAAAGAFSLKFSNQKETLCVTVATTLKFVVSKYGWFYYGCTRCSSKAPNPEKAYECSCGQKVEQPIPRYKIEIYVSNGESKYRFVFWDSECAAILGMTAEFMHNSMVEVHCYT
ncbi:hypothetical protein KIW84_UN0281 [Lathyrus oleraceus]|nr:hypothetical protein KIW84_UN0281 [Pisum sativum]